MSASSLNRAAGATSLEVPTITPQASSETDSTSAELRLQDIHHSLVDSAAEGMCGMDADGVITFVNPALARMTGWSEAELLGLPYQSVVGQLSIGSDPGAPVRRGEDARLLRKEGGSFPAAYTCSLIFRDGKLSATVIVFHQQRYQAIAQRSEADDLRTSPAQFFLEQCLQPAMENARQRKKTIAVGYMHLDRLKEINASLGHEYGAALIKALGDRLNPCLRDVDIPIRYGGGAFLFALCELNQASEAEDICQRLLRALRQPLLVKGHLLATTASIGISLFPHHGVTADLLLSHAEVALEAVKRADRGGTLIYSAALGQQSRRAAEMPEALLYAIRHRQFHVAYQPIYNMNKQIMGFEALLRWKHPEWGYISPLDFIPIAERTGLIVPIGDWVIHEVCRQAMAWGAHSLPGIKFFANVSGVQLERSDFASKIANTLRRSGLPPDRLELEITESWVISDLEGAARKLMSLRDLGIGIAIDDFGTGHSTFTYLQELPLDTIKIDRSFTSRLDGSDARPSTVRAITLMAQRLGLKTVAEGVETAEQAAELADIGCDLMQGFLLSRPLMPDDASALLKEQLACGSGAVIDTVASTQLSESRP